MSVWSSIEKCPGYPALVHALERRVGSSAAGLIHMAGDSTEVSRLFADGGFPDADVVTLSNDAIYASAEEFTRAIVVGAIMRRTETKFYEETLGLMAAVFVNPKVTHHDVRKVSHPLVLAHISQIK